MQRQSLFLSLAFATISMASAQNIIGEWNGTLSAGGAELRLALHINKAKDGTLSGTLDSLDQGANGIPISTITLKDSELAFSVDAIHGSYEGKLKADSSSINGSWSQGQTIPLEFKRGPAAKVEHKPTKPSDLDGAWAGTLDTGTTKLRLVFHITNTEDGLTATADSPDQNATGMPVTSVTRNGSSLKLEMKQLGGVFEGVIDKNLTAIEGTWSQGGGSMPLLLKRI